MDYFYCLLKPLNPDLSPVEEGLMLLAGDSCAASGYRLTFITPAQRFTFLKATFWLPTLKKGNHSYFTTPYFSLHLISSGPSKCCPILCKAHCLITNP